MARKNLLLGLTGAGLPAGNSAPETACGRRRSPSPISVGARGAIGAVTRSIEQLKAQAVVEIAADLIDASFISDRLEISAESQAELVQSMREHGQQVPILVRPHPRGAGPLPDRLRPPPAARRGGTGAPGPGRRQAADRRSTGRGPGPGKQRAHRSVLYRKGHVRPPARRTRFFAGNDHGGVVGRQDRTVAADLLCGEDSATKSSPPSGRRRKPDATAGWSWRHGWSRPLSCGRRARSSPRRIFRLLARMSASCSASRRRRPGPRQKRRRSNGPLKMAPRWRGSRHCAKRLARDRREGGAAIRGLSDRGPA